MGYGCKQSENNKLEIDWGSQPPAPEDVLQLLACHCSGACRQSQCHYLQNSLSCTDACNLFDCENQSTFHYINDDAGDVFGYNDESENEGE